MIVPQISFQIVGTPPIPPLSKALKLLKFVQPNPAYVRRVREIVGPNTLFLYRWWEKEQNLDNPVARAREWFERRIMELVELSDCGPFAVEGYNEVAGGDAPRFENAMAYCAFEIERIRLLEDQGWRAVVLNASVGRPDFDEWACYDPLLNQLRASMLRHLVGLHSYWTSFAGIENRYHLFRHWLPAVVAHLEGLQVVDTEGGREWIRDEGLPEDQWGKPGWQLTATPDEFCDDLERLGHLAQVDHNYVGMTLFQYGSEDSAYAAYDVSPILARLKADHDSFEAAAPEPLPEYEPLATPAKVAWWAEELLRLLETQAAVGAMAADGRAMKVARGLVKLAIRGRDGK
jgi:hypothetical protein